MIRDQFGTMTVAIYVLVNRVPFGTTTVALYVLVNRVPFGTMTVALYINICYHSKGWGHLEMSSF